MRAAGICIAFMVIIIFTASIAYGEETSESDLARATQKPDFGPDWTLRLQLQFLFPK